MSERIFRRVVLLAGGVGGARMAEGFQRVLPPESLTVIVNVGDDEIFHGLKVCPDLDTVLYTLSGRVDPDRGWGVRGDSVRALEVLRLLGAPDAWMTLGDADLGVHLHRSQRLSAGMSLTAVTADIARALGVRTRVLPVSDQPWPTQVQTDEGLLSFQTWFVQRQCRPGVRALVFGEGGVLRAQGEDGAWRWPDGGAVDRRTTWSAIKSLATPAVLDALQAAELVVIAPSNPWLSILPVLSVPGVLAGLSGSVAPRLVVSPLIGGEAVKGPLTRLMVDLGVSPGNLGIARFYQGLVDGMVIDRSDATDASALRALGLKVLSAPTRMVDAERAARLAKAVLAWAGTNKFMTRSRAPAVPDEVKG